LYLYKTKQIEFDDRLIIFLEDEIALFDSRKKKKKNKKNKIDVIECPICLIDLEEYETIKLECNHVFHISCIEEWCNKDKSCPYCRNIIE
jgi:hypothetical protein